MYEEGVVRDSMKVVVGDLDHRTPLIASLIHYTTINPYWSPPEDLVRNKIAPAVVQQGPSYLRDREYEVFSGWTDDSQLLSPDEVDWAAVAAGVVKVRLRRKPSPANPMGRIKIPFGNDMQIYLHDTPAKGLFDQERRALSNGCIRLEDARRLAKWLLGREPVAPSSSPEKHLQLREPVPIYLTYLTAHPMGDRLTLSEDVYGLDREWDQELASAGRGPPQRTGRNFR
jgi:murein L,D-transpeptidase YcbB/YkuD